MTNGDFIRSMTDEDITENFTRGICELIKHRDPERCQNREHSLMSHLRTRKKFILNIRKMFRLAGLATSMRLSLTTRNVSKR